MCSSISKTASLLVSCFFISCFFVFFFVSWLCTSISWGVSLLLLITISSRIDFNRWCNTNEQILLVELVDRLHSHVFQEFLVGLHIQLILHNSVRLCLDSGDLDEGLHVCLIGNEGRIVLRLGLIDNHWRLDTRLVNLRLHINNHILLCLLHSDTLLDGNIRCL